MLLLLEFKGESPLLSFRMRFVELGLLLLESEFLEFAGEIEDDCQFDFHRFNSPLTQQVHI